MKKANKYCQQIHKLAPLPHFPPPADMRANLADELEIVWLEPKEKYPYLRESIGDFPQRRCFPQRMRPGGDNPGGPRTHLVAYAVLRSSADSSGGCFRRRYWWVKKYDRFQGHGADASGECYELGSCPVEAVRTDTIVAGIPSLRGACMDDRDAATHVHPALATTTEPSR